MAYGGLDLILPEREYSMIVKCFTLKAEHSSPRAPPIKEVFDAWMSLRRFYGILEPSQLKLPKMHAMAHLLERCSKSACHDYNFNMCLTV